VPATVARTSRLITVAALVAMAALSWAWLVRSAAVMTAMRGDGLLMAVATAMMEPAAAIPYLGATALMWIVMMVAMMTPAVLPVVLVFSRLDRRGGSAPVDGALFAGGYLAAWGAFGVAASALQRALHQAALLQTHALSADPALAGAILLGAGMYQLTPLKTACLRHCQTPLGFLLSHWRDGAWGAFRMGVRHGTYCVGCCWALMLLMFVSGVMSVGAMAILTCVVLSERLLSSSPWTARLPGGALIAWGIWTVAQAQR
jgi:predicted metal-binding membrane protein